jgi:alanine racemase
VGVTRFSSPLPSGRPTWAEIDLGALVRNYRTLCKLQKTRIIPVIKANAYGHGAIEVAQALELAGAGMFAVAIVEEALQLRKSGITNPEILVLDGAWPGEEEEAIRKRLDVAVYSVEAVRRLEAAASEIAHPATVQIKVDTGMNRLGVPWKEVAPLADALLQCPHLVLSGTFSHFAGSEEDDVSFAEEQIRRFQDALVEIKAAGLDPGELHFSNSGGMLYCESLRNLSARPGIALYGYPPEPDRSPVRLDPVLSVKTRIARIHTIHAGESVGYNRIFFADRMTRVATLPIGYADGYRRDFSGRGRVIIRDCWAPVLGRVSMDLITVDITHLPEVQAGEEVIVLGSSPSCRMDAGVWAEMLRTIPYEVLTSLGPRIPRVYVTAETQRKT